MGNATLDSHKQYNNNKKITKNNFPLMQKGSPLTLALVALGNHPLPPPPSSLTPPRSRAEFTFFHQSFKPAAETLSSADQNRPVDTSGRVPERHSSCSAPLIGSLRRKRCRTERSVPLHLQADATASLGRDKQRRDGGSKVGDDV